MKEARIGSAGIDDGSGQRAGASWAEPDRPDRQGRSGSVQGPGLCKGSGHEGVLV